MKKIVISSNTCWNIYNFRYNLIQELIKKKYKIFVLANLDNTSVLLENMGCEMKYLRFSRKKKSILEGKKLLIVGGGDSALDWTNELSKTSNVTLMHRRKEFKASPDSVSKMLELEKDKKVNFLLGQIKGIEDLKNDKIKVITKNNEETKNFEVDYLLPFFGLKMELGPIANWGLNLDENLIKVDTEKFETSVPSIFAIGDINTYPGKLKLILSGFHEGALAARACFKLARPNEKYRFEFTTTSKSLLKRLGKKE
jgi:thioredoxin reductase (NADPH)